METLSKKLAMSIGEATEADDEKIAVIAYGLIAIMQFFIIFIIAGTIGLIFNFFLETMIVFLSVGFLRRVIGGAHSANFNSCILISILCIDLFSFISRYLITPYIDHTYIIIAILIVYILAYILVYKLAPVENPNKPIRKVEKIKKLRKQAFLVLTVFFVLSIVLYIIQFFYGGYYISYATSLAISVLWQVMMLTSLGKEFIKIIDKLFGVNCF